MQQLLEEDNTSLDLLNLTGDCGLELSKEEWGTINDTRWHLYTIYIDI